MNIERKENLKTKEIKIKEKKDLKEKWLLEKYWWIDIIWVKENVFWVIAKKWNNILYYVNNKDKLLFSLPGIVKDLWKKKYGQYLEKIWYKAYKDIVWHYHMIDLKTWKEIPQESLKYYEIFETLWNIQYRDYLSDVIYEKWLKEEWEKLKKMPNLREQMDEIIFPKLEKMSKFYVLKPVELLLFKKYWIIEENHFKELKKKVYTFDYIKKLIENPVWDYVEWKITIKKINWQIYKLNTNQITEDELKLYLDLNIINKQEYELLKDILEKRKLEQEKKEHIDKTRKHISGLERDVRNLW